MTNKVIIQHGCVSEFRKNAPIDYRLSLKVDGKSPLTTRAWRFGLSIE